MIRFNIHDPKDREFLKKRGLLDDYLKDVLKSPIVAIEPEREKRSYVDSGDEKMKKFNKYNNKIITVDGVKWRSKYEYECYLVLKDLEDQGKIKNLKTQVPVVFKYNGVQIWKTVPDYYFEVHVGDEVYPIYADAKHSFTNKSRTFQTGQKMFRAFFGTEMLVFLQDKKTNIEQAIKEFKIGGTAPMR